LEKNNKILLSSWLIKSNILIDIQKKNLNNSFKLKKKKLQIKKAKNLSSRKLINQ